MALTFHPKQGTIVMCDYDLGFKTPEMQKRRPTIVVSPPIGVRARLCTVVPLSLTAPTPKMPYHYELTLAAPLPRPFESPTAWVKGDMVCAVSFERLDLIRLGRDGTGKRQYRTDPIPLADLVNIQKAILSSLGLATLTKHI